MYIDKLLQVSDAQTITSAAASADVIDFGQKQPNVGLSAKPLHMVFTIEEGASAAVTFKVQDSEDNSSFADVISTGALDKASLGAGAVVALPMPTTHRRYVRAYYQPASTLSKGKFSAQVVAGLQLNEAQAEA